MTATTQAGRVKIMALLLDECVDELPNVEPRDNTHAARISVLLARCLDALAELRRDPDGVDIDAAHLKLEG